MSPGEIESCSSCMEFVRSGRQTPAWCRDLRYMWLRHQELC